MNGKDAQYEIICLFYADSNKFQTGRDEVRDTLKELDIKIIGEEHMGLRSLAYPINKEKQGNYFLYRSVAAAENAHKVRSKLKHYTKLLRMMVIKNEEPWLT